MLSRNYPRIYVHVSRGADGFGYQVESQWFTLIYGDWSKSIALGPSPKTVEFTKNKVTRRPNRPSSSHASRYFFDCIFVLFVHIHTWTVQYIIYVFCEGSKGGWREWIHPAGLDTPNFVKLRFRPFLRLLSLCQMPEKKRDGRGGAIDREGKRAVFGAKVRAHLSRWPIIDCLGD